MTAGQQFLIALWEEHLSDEFKTCDTDATLQTMTPDAYVNHIPVLTGGVGQSSCANSTRATLSLKCHPLPPLPRSPEPLALTGWSTR